MSLDIGDAISEGFDRATDRNGLVLVGIFVVFGLLNTVTSHSLGAAYLDAFAPTIREVYAGTEMESFVLPVLRDSSQAFPLAAPIPLPVAALLLVVLAVVAEGLRVLAIRVFASDERERIPATATDGIGMATLNAFLAGIVVSVLTGLGSILLLPGLFLAVALYFVRPAIALEDANAIEALSRSWRLTKGDRIELFLLLVLVWFFSLALSIPGIFLDPVSPLASAVVGIVLSGVFLPFSIAVATEAFLQLREAESETVGAVGPDDELFEETP